MKLTASNEQFIRNNKDDLYSIFEAWMDDLKDRLVEEEDNDKAAMLRKFIHQFKAFTLVMRFINKEDKKDKIDVI